ncbi:hypothetical protein [Escherichia phage vB_EcoP_PAS7]|uniref:Uncharacterized protein n=1 Tax=Escherichia phage vB_EcoP_PAS7 TaxID=3053875 RepID=A0AA51VIF5_9CAUD|nr:hypothetical protein [Escherichia phage vB_EcoP_PAS7]
MHNISNPEEMKDLARHLLEALDYSTATSDDGMVWLENFEVGILRDYIEYLENKLK